jgi:hypothetical protein
MITFEFSSSVIYHPVEAEHVAELRPVAAFPL